MNRFSAMLWLLVLSLLAPARAELPQYVIRDLGTFGHTKWAGAYDINNQGQIVGSMGDVSNQDRAFLWDGQVHDLGPGTARAINESGVVVGDVKGYMPGYTADGFVWDGQRHDVEEGYVFDINAGGDLAGQTEPEYHAFVLARGVFRDIHVPGAETSMAQGINDSGHVVFNCDFGYIFDVYQRAFVWDGVIPKQLGTFGGESSIATDINNAGKVVGWAQMADGGDAGFLWDGTLHNIGRGLRPHALNQSDWIVGLSSQGAFVYAAGELKYLPTLGGFAQAEAINDSGYIVGMAVAPDGTGRAVIWEPVPEPTSMLILVCGLAGLAATRRR